MNNTSGDNTSGENISAENTAAEIPQDSKNMAVLIWILTFFFGFIPGLIFYLEKKDDAYIQDQSKEAMNWAITTIFAYIVSVVLAFILIGFVLMFALCVVHVVFCIMGAFATSNGKPFRVPYAVRLIK
jgi:uncharacterized Tic20 family protein